MHATAVEKIAPQTKGSLETPRWILPPAISILISSAPRDQAEAQLAEAQKAMNALKQLPANSAQ